MMLCEMCALILSESRAWLASTSRIGIFNFLISLFTFHLLQLKRHFLLQYEEYLSESE
jgi:hypothetical protein